MMSRYEGDPFEDLSSRELEESAISSAEFGEDAQSSYFERDLAEFVRGTKLILEQADIRTEQATGTRFSTNVYQSPPNGALLQAIVYGQLGYDVYFMDNATTLFGKRSPELLAVYAADEIRGRIRFGGINSSEQQEEFELESALNNFFTSTVGAMINDRYLDPEWLKSNNSIILEEFEAIGDYLPQLLRRGFMTSTLIRNIRNADTNASIYVKRWDEKWGRKNQNLLLYEKLAEEGVKPLGYEELLGMASRTIRHEMKANPDFPPLPPRSK